MSDRAWEDLVDRLDMQFGIKNQRKFKRPLEDEPRLEQTIDQIDFVRAGQDFRVERISSPAIEDRKTNYNKTGIATSSHTTYDPSELVHKVIFYRLSGGEAVEISPEELLH